MDFLTAVAAGLVLAGAVFLLSKVTGQSRLARERTEHSSGDIPNDAASLANDRRPFLRRPGNQIAIGLLGAFFLPWGQLAGISGSGFEIAQMGSYGTLAWIPPTGAVAALWLDFNDQPYWASVAAALVMIPVLIGCTILILEYKGAFFHLAGIGWYATVVLTAIFPFGYKWDR